MSFVLWQCFLTICIYKIGVLMLDCFYQLFSVSFYMVGTAMVYAVFILRSTE